MNTNVGNWRWPDIYYAQLNRLPFLHIVDKRNNRPLCGWTGTIVVYNRKTGGPLIKVCPKCVKRYTGAES